MTYKWRVVYKPPIEKIDYNNIDSLPKVFYYSIYDCPEKIDLAVELERLKKLYHMKDEYLYLEDMEDIDKIEKL